MRAVLLVVVGALCLSGRAAAQISSTATPVYHGDLKVSSTPGTIDPLTGSAILRVRNWRFAPVVPGSNGLFPAQEPIVVALAANNFLLPAGVVKEKRPGKLFVYKAQLKPGQPGFRSFRMVAHPSAARCTPIPQSDCTYSVSFTLVGLELSGLLMKSPDCQPMAVIVGDDDAFSGVNLERRIFSNSRRFKVASSCNVGNDWPWIQ